MYCAPADADFFQTLSAKGCRHADVQSRHRQDMDQSRVLHYSVEGLLQTLRLSKQNALHQSQHRRAVERLGGAAQLLL